MRASYDITSGVLKHCRYALPLLKRSFNPVVVNVHRASEKEMRASITYDSCKASIDSVTRLLINDFAKYNVKVNSIITGSGEIGFRVCSSRGEEITAYPLDFASEGTVISKGKQGLKNAEFIRRSDVFLCRIFNEMQMLFTLF